MTIHPEPIAIVGIGCRFPGANNPQAFWQLLRQGIDAIQETPSSRWDADAYYDPDPFKPNKTNSRWGGFVEGIETFDPQFFGMTPRETTSMDPQQRLILETSWEALEDGGQIADRLAGTKTGVFVGIGAHDYSVLLWHKPFNDTYGLTGTANSIAANRVSYWLDLKGPSIAVDTACSSALVAIHLACQSLWMGESTMALAGGVNILLNPYGTVGFTKGGFLSPDGRCQSFDVNANGYVRSEGAGMILLKPLTQAQQDNDRIYALIRNTAINQDGRTEAIAVPNLEAQIELLQTVYQQAGINPAQVQYLEAHGTGTKVGDFIEIQSLGTVLSQGREPGNNCLIGSVKSNIGHLETASGIAGLIKTALALNYQQIPPSLHFRQPNPNINLDKLGLEVATRLTSWPKLDQPQIAGVNSFGFGGTNAHAVLQAATVLRNTSSPVKRPLHLLTLSAKTTPALQALALEYQDFLSDHPVTPLADICYSANARRTQFNHRLTVIGANGQQLRSSLTNWLQEKEDNRVRFGQISGVNRQPIVFLFTGQGSQYTHMGRELYETQPYFRQIIDHCTELLKDDLDIPLSELLYPQSSESVPSLTSTIYAQPALFAVEYAIAQLWMSWGIKPEVVIGHSLGEYVASCIAGVFTLAEGLKLVSARGKLMQSLPRNGAMIAVSAPESLINQQAQGLAIAAINAKDSWVLSGKIEDIEQARVNLSAQGVKTTPLEVSHAFHSPLMREIETEFRAIASTINYRNPQISLIANLTGDFITQEIADAEYWCQHLYSCVRFFESMITLQEYGEPICLEIGPNPILLVLGKKIWTDAGLANQGLWLPSLRSTLSDWQQMLSSLSELFLAGVKIDWKSFEQHYSSRLVSLPYYPFQRQYYWYNTNLNNHSAVHPLIGSNISAFTNASISFSTQISLDSPSYLSEHCLETTAVLPASAYIEMALAAGRQFLTDLYLEKVIFTEFLTLSPETTYNLEIILKEDHPNCYDFQIYSDKKTCHAQGKIIKGKPPTLPQYELDQIKAQCTQVFPVAQHYQNCQSLGLNYGVRFQKIQHLWLGQQQGLSQVAQDGQASLYQIHPTVLDACFQGLGAIIPQEEAEEIYLPVEVERVIIYNQCNSEAIWCHFALDSQSPGIKANLRLWDNQGKAIAEIQGLSLLALKREFLRQKLQQSEADLYEIVWQIQPQQTEKDSRIRNWLIFAETEEFAVPLANCLKKHRMQVILVLAGENYAQKEEHYLINPYKSQNWERLFRELNLENFGIIHLGGSPSFCPEKNQKLGCGSVLHLMQGLNLYNWKQCQKLLLVTRNTQKVKEDEPDLNPEQASLWGLARVIRLEYPDLACICLDLEPTNLEKDLVILQKEILQNDLEDQIAYRDGDRYVPRLTKKQKPQSLTSSTFQVRISQYGDLDQLTLVPLTQSALAPDEVEIEVYTVGLNFRDVLNALGMLRPHLEATEIPLGGECAGKIIALGKNVTQFQIGDEVIAALAKGSLASSVKVKSELVIHKPSNLGFVEAATIPTAFLTAYYGLYTLANLQPGEKILIHGGAGGVGQAAIQLAQQKGARIFVTASPSKWKTLTEMGVEKIFNSRTLDFAEAIREWTNGEGVDVILNSFNGDYIPKNLEILAAGGRFVEIGKIGIWNQEQVQQKRDDIAYFHFDLLQIALTEPLLIKNLLKELMGMFAEQKLNPLPSRTFPIQECTQAFRYLAAAKHIGKVVITLPKLMLSADASYLITGGWGALGLKIANWLVQKGAKSLILLGYSQPSAEALAQIQTWQQSGVEVKPLQANLGDRQAIEHLFRDYPQIRGIIHSAGTIEDAYLINQNWESFERVFASKIAGTWHLHQATEKLNLDFFVCFSSIVSLLGSQGQGNYVAANAFMDALMHHRRQLGLSGLSINWGPWSHQGMAASLEQKGYFSQRGIATIPPDVGLAILEELLLRQYTQVAVFSVDWKQFFLKSPPQHRLSPFLSEFYAPTNLEKSSTPVHNLESLKQYLQTQIAQVLGFSSTNDIDPEQDFQEFGLDSLMIVEFKTKLEKYLAITLENSIISQYSSVNLLADYLLKEVVTPLPVQTEEDCIIPLEYYKFELSDKYLNLQEQIAQLKHLRNPFFTAREGLPSTTVTIQGQELINYSSYNYLGLADSPEVAQATIAAIKQYGTSVSASRILSGEITLHQELEQEIADFIGTEACIVYIGGHTTNTTTIGDLFTKGDLILYDAYAHNSIRQGCALSGAKAIEFPHNDHQILAKLLQQNRQNYQQVLIVIEGIYSGDGDIAPLPEIIALRKQYKTFLMVDEAHSIGVLGKTGRGIGEYFGVSRQEVDLWMGTLSKSFGSCGGYIAASGPLIEYLKYRASGFVFSVGMSPANTAAALEAIRIVKSEPERVERLRDRTQLFLALAESQGFNLNKNINTPIVPIIVGSSQRAIELSNQLFQRGINVLPMISPSVPYDQARLRFFITCNHTEQQMRWTLAQLRSLS
ncbi:type I polyketide synthase [Gloeocapsa sp. PCC 73106]|uniref:type I polyketide synthase n=1 Tax=Gloeocapsa sp. PCC 73106 TaxID=102232 RepID=UPI0002ABFB34|nr:type I polyketide synthase [Gloeocapsa sp. PCC 73106]ELR97352.1 polyketide synthase family protein [Gloeocapsa sp. PCC 73106]